MKLQIYFLIIASQLLILAKVYLIIYFIFFKNSKKGYASVEAYKIDGGVHVSKSDVHLSKSGVYLSPPFVNCSRRCGLSTTDRNAKQQLHKEILNVKTHDQ